MLRAEFACSYVVRILKESLGCLVKQRVWLLVLWFWNQGIRLQCYFNIFLLSTCFVVLFFFLNSEMYKSLTLCSFVQGRHCASLTGLRGILWWQLCLAGQGRQQVILNFRFYYCLTSCCVQECIGLVERCDLDFFLIFSLCVFSKQCASETQGS